MAKPLLVPERADRLLRHIADQSESVGSYCYFSEEDVGFPICSEPDDPDDVAYLLKYLNQEGWIETPSTSSVYGTLRLTVSGYNKIDDEIVAEIRRSKFIIADFSHGSDGARGGVYFEAGFAHGLS